MNDPVDKIKIYLNRVSIKISNKLYTLKELMDELGYKYIEKIECSYVSQIKIFIFDNPDHLVPLEENMNIIINKDPIDKSSESQNHKLAINRDIPEEYKSKIPNYVLDKVGSKGGWAVGNDKKHKEIEKSENDPKLLSKPNAVWIPVNHETRLYQIPVGMTTIKDIREKCNIDKDKRIIYTNNEMDIYIPYGEDSIIHVNKTLKLFTFDKNISAKKCIKRTRKKIKAFEKVFGKKLSFYNFTIDNVQYATWVDKMKYYEFYRNFILPLQEKRELINSIYIKFKEINYVDLRTLKHIPLEDGIGINIDDIKVQKEILNIENLRSIKTSHGKYLDKRMEPYYSRHIKSRTHKFTINNIEHSSDKPFMTHEEFYRTFIESYLSSNENFDSIKIENKTTIIPIEEIKYNKNLLIHISNIDSVEFLDTSPPKKNYDIIINGKTYVINKNIITKKDIIELYKDGDETYNVAFYNKDTNRIEDFGGFSLILNLRGHPFKPIFYISKEKISSYSFTVNGKHGYLPFRKVSIEMVATELRHIYPNYYSNLNHPVEMILNENSKNKFFYFPLDKSTPIVLHKRLGNFPYDIDLLVNDAFHYI